MWIAHAKNITPDAPKLLEEELRSLIIEQFQKIPRAEHTLYQKKIVKSSDLLKEIVNEVIDFDLDLDTVLKQHNIE
ncbi:MAG: hypothetical protein LLF94_04430 [Chlamydiales bacterium]|nr:hypothetical protein [Chlamydiales bacterium]